MKLLIIHDAQSRMLALEHCKRHDSLNHYNFVWCSITQTCTEVCYNLCKVALSYWYGALSTMLCLKMLDACIKVDPGLKMHASEETPNE